MDLDANTTVQSFLCTPFRGTRYRGDEATHWLTVVYSTVPAREAWWRSFNSSSNRDCRLGLVVFQISNTSRLIFLICCFLFLISRSVLYWGVTTVELVPLWRLQLWRVQLLQQSLRTYWHYKKTRIEIRTTRLPEGAIRSGEGQPSTLSSRSNNVKRTKVRGKSTPLIQVTSISSNTNSTRK